LHGALLGTTGWNTSLGFEVSWWFAWINQIPSERFQIRININGGKHIPEAEEMMV